MFWADLVVLVDYLRYALRQRSGNDYLSDKMFVSMRYFTTVLLRVLEIGLEHRPKSHQL
jgi:hypothetical protein